MGDFLSRAEGFGGMQKGLDPDKEAQKAIQDQALPENRVLFESADGETKELNKGFVEAMGKGRQKGQVNRLTRTMKEAIEKAFNDVGGSDYLVRLANGTSSDRQAFAALIGRLLPMQVNSNIDQRIRVELPWLAQRGIGKVNVGEADALALVGKGRTIDAETPDGQGAAGGMHDA